MRNSGQSTLTANRSKSLSADQEEIISNFTRKFEHVYKNNDVKNINDYLLFGTMATYQPEEVVVIVVNASKYD